MVKKNTSRNVNSHTQPQATQVSAQDVTLRCHLYLPRLIPKHCFSCFLELSCSRTYNGSLFPYRSILMPLTSLFCHLLSLMLSRPISLSNKPRGFSSPPCLCLCCFSRLECLFHSASACFEHLAHILPPQGLHAHPGLFALPSLAAQPRPSPPHIPAHDPVPQPFC